MWVAIQLHEFFTSKVSGKLDSFAKPPPTENELLVAIG
jgi:hypothetical protein